MTTLLQRYLAVHLASRSMHDASEPLARLRPAPGELTVLCPHCLQRVSETCCAYQGYGYYKDCYHYITRPFQRQGCIGG